LSWKEKKKKTKRRKAPKFATFGDLKNISVWEKLMCCSVRV
jgi:hypothetical protein